MMKGICLFWAVIMLIGVSNAWSEGEATTIIIGILMIATFIAIYKRIDKDENRIKELQKKMRGMENLKFYSAIMSLDHAEPMNDAQIKALRVFADKMEKHPTYEDFLHKKIEEETREKEK